MKIEKARALPIIKAALKEDIGAGDCTTGALIDPLASTEATLVTREECVVCGMQIAEWIAAQVDYSVRFKPNCEDGDVVGAGKELAFLEGHTASILRAERTMLNFMTFLSGIATYTKGFVDKARPYGVKIMDTRKTLPLLRYLEKYAVCVGGGANHRMGLYDQALIKDNHIACHRSHAAFIGEKEVVSIGEIVRRCRKNTPKGMIVEVEVETVADFESALTAKPDIIMLDNMRPEEVAACVERRRMSKAKPLLEVSGGITLDTVASYAKTRVDMISIGSLTDSVHAIDMSLDIAV